jgi:hypothetical protein
MTWVVDFMILSFTQNQLTLDHVNHKLQMVCYYIFMFNNLLKSIHMIIYFIKKMIR